MHVARSSCLDRAFRKLGGVKVPPSARVLENIRVALQCRMGTTERTGVEKRVAGRSLPQPPSRGLSSSPHSSSAMRPQLFIASIVSSRSPDPIARVSSLVPFPKSDIPPRPPGFPGPLPPPPPPPPPPPNDDPPWLFLRAFRLVEGGSLWFWPGCARKCESAGTKATRTRQRKHVEESGEEEQNTKVERGEERPHLRETDAGSALGPGGSGAVGFTLCVSGPPSCLILPFEST